MARLTRTGESLNGAVRPGCLGEDGRAFEWHGETWLPGRGVTGLGLACKGCQGTSWDDTAATGCAWPGEAGQSGWGLATLGRTTRGEGGTAVKARIDPAARGERRMGTERLAGRGGTRTHRVMQGETRLSTRDAELPGLAWLSTARRDGARPGCQRGAGHGAALGRHGWD